MKMQITLTLKNDERSFSPFSRLMQSGFQVKTHAGSSIKNLLCSQFNIDEQILENRIKIIFLDGKSVDDPEIAKIKEGSIVALSPPVGGLVGTTFLKGSPLAGMRNDITHFDYSTNTVTSEKVMITIKLFGLMIGEVGPTFLQQGIWLTKENMQFLVLERYDSLKPFILSVGNTINGLDLSHPGRINWSEVPQTFFLGVNTN